MRKDWRDNSACSKLSYTESNEIFFIKPGQSANRARLFCRLCPVKRECENYAIMYSERGIWAGTTEEERDSIDPWVRRTLRENAAAAGELETREIILTTKPFQFDPELEDLLRWAGQLEEAHDHLFEDSIDLLESEG